MLYNVLCEQEFLACVSLQTPKENSTMCVASFKIILGLTLVLFVIEALFSLMFRGRRNKVDILHADLPGWRSYATFKLLPGAFRIPGAPASTAQETGGALMRQWSEALKSKGVVVKSHKRVGDAERVTFDFEGGRWQVTLGLYQEKPQTWLMTVDESYGRRGTSAPHDTPQARALFGLLKAALMECSATNVRWHARERWNSGQIDAWSHRPVD